MSLSNLNTLVNVWREQKLKGFVYEANRLEVEIIEKARIEIKSDLAECNEQDLNSAIHTVTDLFIAYNEIRVEGSHLGDKKILLLSDIKQLKIQDRKWGLAETELYVLKKKEEELNLIDLKLQLYNHLVNFNVPEAIELYSKVSGIDKARILLEIYKFIDEQSFEMFVKERKILNG